MSKTPLSIIDSHCHLDFAVFDEDRNTILHDCFKLGVHDLVIPGVMSSNWEVLQKIVNEHSAINLPRIHFALGMHPVFLDRHEIMHLDQLEKSLNNEAVIAIGEIGLDFYLKKLNQAKQIQLFSDQLSLAKQHSLPVILHVRKAHDQTIQLLQKHTVTGGIVHAFNGSIQQAKKYIDLNFKLGFGGMLTYERSNKLRQLSKTLPLESMVLETDSPDMTVSQHKGTRNSPAYLPYVLQALSEIRNEPLERIAQTTRQNTIDVLSLPI